MAAWKFVKPAVEEPFPMKRELKAIDRRDRGPCSAVLKSPSL